MFDNMESSYPVNVMILFIKIFSQTINSSIYLNNFYNYT